jgi:pyruvate formate lyase activating enzyme
MNDYKSRGAVGRIYDIQGYAVHDGPGVRTTVYLKGCPLRCLWCHSPESQDFGFELGYLDVKCVGVKECDNSCVSACPAGALSADEPGGKFPGSGAAVRKVSIDREKCTRCLKCAEACLPGALYTAGKDAAVGEVFERLLRDRIFFKNGGGVTISGGEAMSQFDFTYELSVRLKEAGIHVCLDTTGFAPEEHFAKIMPYTDLFLYDLKCMDSALHERLTGVPNELILENARFLAENGAALQIRIPVIPKLNDREELLGKAAEFCVSLGESVKLVQLLPYHATGKGKYARLGREYKLKNVEAPDDSRMAQILDIFKSCGLNCQIH